MAISIISALTNIPVRKDVAMTGEITLRGRILPVGGIKEKTLAAMRGKIRTVIIPDQNKRDLDEIPPYARKRMNFVLAKHMDDILPIALERAKLRRVRPIGETRK
jgi:ATP-dependent Lon protease